MFTDENAEARFRAAIERLEAWGARGFELGYVESGNRYLMIQSMGPLRLSQSGVALTDVNVRGKTNWYTRAGRRGRRWYHGEGATPTAAVESVVQRIDRRAHAVARLLTP